MKRYAPREALWSCFITGFLFLTGFLFWATIHTDFCQAQLDMPFSAEPAPGTASYKTGYFLVNASPGETATETLSLRNDSGASLGLRIMSVDATTGLYGGISYGLPGDPVTGVGTWTSLPISEIDLPPYEQKNIPVSIKIPTGITAGDYVSGVAIWLPKAGGQTKPGQAGQSASIDTQVRRVLAVHVVVSGPSQPLPFQPLLVINGVAPVVKPDGIYLEVAISNEGKLLTKGEGFIELPNDNFQHDVSLDTFIPGTSIAYPIKWINDPEEKTYQAHVVIHYNQDRLVAEWKGSFSIGPKLISREKAREGGESQTLLYLFIFVVAACLATGLLIFGWRRRKRKKNSIEAGQS